MAKKKRTGYKVVTLMLHILTMVLVIVVIAWLATLTYHFAYKVFADMSYLESDGIDNTATIRVEDDSSAMDVAEMLENANLIESKWTFWFQITFAGGKDDMSAGSYRLSTDMTASEIIGVLTTHSEEEEEETSTSSSSTGSVTAGSADLLDSSLSEGTKE